MSPLPLSRLLLAALLMTALCGVASPALAATSPDCGFTVPPAVGNCDEPLRDCAELTDEELLAAAHLEGGQLSLGSCYYHTREACPSCACPFYVKLSFLDPPSGFDGGTGCLQTEAEVLAALRSLCASGQCGCPSRQRCPDDVCAIGSFWGRDPATGHCCEYGDTCLIPNGWQHFGTESECKNVVFPPSNL